MATEDLYAIEISNIRKEFGSFVALNDVSLKIVDNEFFTLLGPSGCGKTTLLRLIAGFETPTSGEIKLYGKSIQDLLPNKRPINTVFQNYALFPHMNVFDNIKFGLKMLGKDKAFVESRAMETLELVQLTDFKDRKPSQLSGGQQQRVALARALAPEPELLLLDEPLSALDLKLREQMRHELKQIQRKTRINFIFVTHDQDEALSMSDRIAVVNAGKIQQIGTPEDIYQRPVNKFVAGFIGETSLLPVTLKDSQQDAALCVLENGDHIRTSNNNEIKAGGQAFLSIRPEYIKLSKEKSDNSIQANITDMVYSGPTTEIHLQLKNNALMTARINNNDDGMNNLQQNDNVFIHIPEKRAILLKP